MITFIDTNILLDVFLPDPTWGERSKETLEKAFQEGSLVINSIIYAELAPQFGRRDKLDRILRRIGIQYVHLKIEAAFQAGMAWKRYRNSGGKRDRVLADFLIGAHASTAADRLLTRDRGFYRNYFSRLTILAPT